METPIKIKTPEKLHKPRARSIEEELEKEELWTQQSGIPLRRDFSFRELKKFARSSLTDDEPRLNPWESCKTGESFVYCLTIIDSNLL